MPFDSDRIITLFLVCVPGMSTSSAALAGGLPIHTASSVGFSHGANSLYNTGRPEYADVAFDWLMTHAVTPVVERARAAQPAAASQEPITLRIVDVGAGTGIFTRCLQRALTSFESNYSATHGVSVRFILSAIDPVEGMAERFREFTPGLTIEIGSGESMPSIASHSVDILFAAQSFHWFATPESLREFERVLKPGHGIFVPIWNTQDHDSHEWSRQIRAMVDTHYDESVPRQQTGKWRQVFEPSSESRFAFIDSHQFPRAMVQRGGQDVILNRVFSISVIAALPDAERDALRQRVINILDAHTKSTGEKEFEMEYQCEVYIYQIKP